MKINSCWFYPQKLIFLTPAVDGAAGRANVALSFEIIGLPEIVKNKYETKAEHKPTGLLSAVG